MRAHSLASPDARLYATAIPRSVLIAAAKLPADSWFDPWLDLTRTVADDEVTTSVDAEAYLDAKIAAMTAHASQVTVDGGFFALSNNHGHRILGTEYYIQLAGPPGTSRGLFTT
jgi:N-acetyl-1-D-myo-inositol-2-amino-2-deoxy-alpha-D-glucopyranoside deacetylase